MAVDANKKFTRLLLTSEMQWFDVMSLFRRLDKNKATLSTIEAEEFRESCSIVLPFVKDEMTGEFLEVMNKTAANAIEQSVNRLVASSLKSTLVFGHAVLDSAISELLKFVAEIDAKAFVDRVQEKKRPAKDFLSLDLQQLLTSLVDEFLEQMNKESLKKRIELLFSVCPPKFIALPDELYPELSFDLDRLIRVDRLRHRVVHELCDAEIQFEDIVYLKYVTRMAHKVFAYHYEVKLDEEETIHFCGEHWKKSTGG